MACLRIQAWTVCRLTPRIEAAFDGEPSPAMRAARTFSGVSALAIRFTNVGHGLTSVKHNLRRICHAPLYACRLPVVPSDAERAVALLRYANYAKVGEALLVSRAAVADWAKGKGVTPYRIRQLEQLLRPDLQIDETPRPEWAEGLVSKADAIYRLLQLTAVTPGGVSPELVREIEAARLDALEQSRAERQRAARRPTAAPDPLDG